MEARAGHVFQRKDGIWVARYYNRGKQVQISGEIRDELIYEQQAIVDVINNTANAGSWMTDPFRKDLASESVSEAKSRKALGEWLLQWLDGYVRSKKGFSTITCYETAVNKHIVPCMGHIALSSLSPRIIQTFFDEKSKCGGVDGKPGGMSPKSIENMRFILSPAMRQALENGLVKENNMQLVTIEKADRLEAKALTPDEQNRLIKSCSNCENIATFGIILALHTGRC